MEALWDLLGWLLNRWKAIDLFITRHILRLAQRDRKWRSRHSVSLGQWADPLCFFSSPWEVKSSSKQSESTSFWPKTCFIYILVCDSVLNGIEVTFSKNSEINSQCHRHLRVQTKHELKKSMKSRTMHLSNNIICGKWVGECLTGRRMRRVWWQGSMESV